MPSPLLLFVTKDFSYLHNLKSRASVVSIRALDSVFNAIVLNITVITRVRVSAPAARTQSSTVADCCVN